MLPILTLLALAPQAEASSNIEFRVNGPVLIYIDGQQARLTGKMRQEVVGLQPGTHEVRVTGVFGKTLFEAEIDVPDNTMTWAEWSRGELRVLRTEWLDDVATDIPSEAVPPAAQDEFVAEVPLEPEQSAPVVEVPPESKEMATGAPVDAGPGFAAGEPSPQAPTKPAPVVQAPVEPAPAAPTEPVVVAPVAPEPTAPVAAAPTVEVPVAPVASAPVVAAPAVEAVPSVAAAAPEGVAPGAVETAQPSVAAPVAGAAVATSPPVEAVPALEPSAQTAPAADPIAASGEAADGAAPTAVITDTTAEPTAALESDDPDSLPVLATPAVEEVDPVRKLRVNAGDNTHVEVNINGQDLLIQIDGSTVTINDTDGLDVTVEEADGE